VVHDPGDAVIQRKNSSRARLTLQLAVALAMILAAAGIGAAREDLPADPDSYGYRVFEQGDAECSFSFVDISAGGSAVAFSPSGVAPADDDGGALIALTLPFELYGESSQSVVMSSNGYLALASSLGGDAGGDFSNDAHLPAVPDQAPGSAARIMGYHDDLSGFDTAGSAYQQHFASCPRAAGSLIDEACTILQWTDWAFPGGGDAFDLQVILYHQTFEIVVQLRPGVGSLSGGTLGIQNASAATASQYRPDFVASTDTAVCFFEPRYPPGGPQADLEITKSDRIDVFAPGEQIDYDIGLTNHGPSPLSGVPVTDMVPPTLLNCSWSCLSSEGSLCTAAGNGDIVDSVTLLAQGWVDYVLLCDTATTSLAITNTVTTSLPVGVVDLDPAGNSAGDANVGGAGRTPDGVTLPQPGLLEIDLVASQLSLSWGASCLAGDIEYEIYEGNLGDFSTHEPVTCNTGGTTFLHPIPVGRKYYLVVPANLSYEGSYGVDSSLDERPLGPSACLPRAVASCP
jgi:uncharacterized repeat protein (TIGR01451 family)